MKSLWTALTASALALTACASGQGSLTESGVPTVSGPTVVAAFYPLAYAAGRIGGDRINVIGLTPPGGEPHDLELSAAQVAQIASADLVLYVKGYQPAVDEAVAQQAADHSLDVSADLALLPAASAADDSATDPHVWLNPLNMAAIGSAVASRLSTVDPANTKAFTANDQSLTASMDTLNDTYVAGLANCRSTQMVVSHEAFAYLGAAYGLRQVGISGLSPDAEPSPSRIKDVAEIVAREGISTIYYETLVDPKVARTLADETGAVTAVLDPIEGLMADSTQTYETIMAQNLATLRAGQGCA